MVRGDVWAMQFTRITRRAKRLISVRSGARRRKLAVEQRRSTPLFSVYLLLHPAPHTTRRHIYQFTSIYVLRQSYQLFLRNRVIIIHNSAQLIRERRPITTVFERTTNNHNDAQCKVPRYITKIYVKRLVWGTRGDLSAGSTSVLVDGNSTRRIWKQT